jgi:hypothetical protein
MDFQVNDQTYFVNLGENPGDWEVFVSTPNGARSIPVYNDAADSDDSTIADTAILVEDKQRRKIVN